MNQLSQYSFQYLKYTSLTGLTSGSVLGSYLGWKYCNRHDIPLVSKVIMGPGVVIGMSVFGMATCVMSPITLPIIYKHYYQ